MIQTATPAEHGSKRNEIFLSFGPSLQAALAANVEASMLEDAGRGDPTAMLADPSARRRARVSCRDKAVLCGTDWFDACMSWASPEISVSWLVQEGALMEPGMAICEIEGPARAILTAERSALNFIQTLSGTATAAKKFADLVEGSGAKILDTRKTLPGLRLAQKYAVRIGGGANQRIALDDGILIKENHIASAGGVVQALDRARALKSSAPIQIEVESFDQLRQALAHGAESILLDNFDAPMLRQAVGIRDQMRPATLLEASGGISESTVSEMARAGVDRVSVGEITKKLLPVDFSMRVIEGF